MVKVKLRVPLSSAPRETSSPLANPLRSAPDYSDDEDNDTSRRHDEDVDDQDDDQAEDDEDDEDQDQEADELDELEEEDDADDSLAASASTPKRRSITIKPRTSRGGASASVSPSIEGSASPHSKASKRTSLARIAQVQAMTVEELDALPAAKRRKTAKARGAAGPGRGWRKGLTKGQKPVYELPPAERTPATFGNTANARAAAVPKAETPTPSSAPLAKSKSSSTLAASIEANRGAASTSSAGRASGSGAAAGFNAPATSIKIVAGPGGHTFTGDLSAKAGTAKNPGFRYPPLPSSRAGPPVQPLARIPTSFQAVIPLERNERQPRRWLKAKREILSMGGRPWSIPVFYGGQDRGYEKKLELAATGAPVPAGAGAVASAPGGERSTSKAGTPAAAAKANSPTPTPAQTPTPHQSSSRPPLPAEGARSGSSPLPPPKHLAALAAAQAETNWRGQSPAFLFGGR